jgi:hypothetical protein
MDKMATYIYKIENVKTIDGIEIEIHPLKIKYMREFMDVFNTITPDMSEDQSIDILCDCARIAMKQYFPAFSNDIDDILDNFDLKTVYEILDYSVGIKINQVAEESITTQSNESQSGSSWDDLDLAKLESEAFLLGIWKDYDELERCISIPELMSTISSSRELDYEEKKFLAAIQGVDLEENSESGKGQQEWENMKARVFSGGAATDSRDILALQGQNAIAAGFGIGMGLDYEVVSE